MWPSSLRWRSLKRWRPSRWRRKWSRKRRRPTRPSPRPKQMRSRIWNPTPQAVWSWLERLPRLPKQQRRWRWKKTRRRLKKHRKRLRIRPPRWQPRLPRPRWPNALPTRLRPLSLIPTRRQKPRQFPMAKRAKKSAETTTPESTGIAPQNPPENVDPKNVELKQEPQEPTLQEKSESALDKEAEHRMQ